MRAAWRDTAFAPRVQQPLPHAFQASAESDLKPENAERRRAWQAANPQRRRADESACIAVVRYARDVPVRSRG